MALRLPDRMLLSLTHKRVNACATGRRTYTPDALLQETHVNLAQLGQQWQQTHALQQAQRHSSVAASGAAPSSPQHGHAASSLGLLSLSGGAAVSPKPPAANQLPFDLAALLNPTAAAAAAKKGGASAHKPPPVDPMQEALKAAGSHPGLVPVLLCYVDMTRTGHQLLELRGARGIARMCFAAALGVSSVSQLLAETKATAAAVGGIGTLVDLLRWD